MEPRTRLGERTCAPRVVCARPWPASSRLRPTTKPAASSALGDRLTHLEQSVEAVAVEVERIGEGQRYMTRLFTERGAAAPAPPADGA